MMKGLLQKRVRIIAIRLIVKQIQLFFFIHSGNDTAVDGVWASDVDGFKVLFHHEDRIFL